MRALAAALLLALPSCTTSAKVFGLAVAEDVTRIGGALTNQDAAAGRLADSIAKVREAFEAQQAKLEVQDESIDELKLADAASMAKAAADKLAEEGKVPPAVYGGGAVAIAALIDFLQGLARDRKHDQRERESERRMGASPSLRRRREDDDCYEEEPEPQARAPPRRRRSRAAAGTAASQR